MMTKLKTNKNIELFEYIVLDFEVLGIQNYNRNKKQLQNNFVLK